METIPAPPYISSLPLKLQNRFVSYFPRKYFGFLNHDVQDKYFSHPLLLCKSLQADTAPVLPEGYFFGQIDDSVLQKIIAHPEALPASVYHNRLAKGDAGYFLSVNGEVVNFNWISTRQCGIFCGFAKEIDFLALAPHQAYTYDFYTYCDKRKRGYGTILKQQLLPWLAARGCTELFSCVMYDNQESLNIHMKMRYSLKALPCNFRLMDWQWTRWGSQKQVEEARQWLERYTHNSATRSRQHESCRN